MVPIQLLSIHPIQDACDQHFKRFVSICTILAAAWIEKNQIGDSEEESRVRNLHGILHNKN